MRTEEGLPYMFVDVDRTFKLAFVEPHDKAARIVAVDFLERLVEAIPYITSPCSPAMARTSPRRLTKPNIREPNRHVERMNGILKEVTVRRYYYETRAKLSEHPAAFVDAHNFAKRLKTLKGVPPFEHVSKCWIDQPKRFRLCAAHHFPRQNI